MVAENHTAHPSSQNGRPGALLTQTANLAWRVVKLVDSLPKSRSADVIGRQLLRSGTSVGANYRAACRARSPAEFRAKLGIVEEEVDESLYWLELIGQSGLMKPARLSSLMSDCLAILAMTISSIKTSRLNDKKAKT